MTSTNVTQVQMTFHTKCEELAADGTDHINISFDGHTELGRMLSYFYYSPFIHPYFGPFNCMEGFWRYFKTDECDDNLRKLSGSKAKFYGKTLTPVRRQNFKQIVFSANYHKVIQNPRMMQLLKESTMPFDHYYYFGEGSIPIRPKDYEWMVDCFDTIRTMLINNEPLAEIDYSQTPLRD